MAADVSVESVLRFLRRGGGKVSNAELLTHFRRFLREHEDRARYRETFKRCVNAVATVQHEEGVAYVSLRNRYRPQREDGAQGTHGARPDPDPAEPARILPAAGILNNNCIKDVKAELTSQTGQDPGSTDFSTCREENMLPPPAAHASISQNLWPVGSASSPCSRDTPTVAAPPTHTQPTSSERDDGPLRTDRVPGPCVEETEDHGALHTSPPEVPEDVSSTRSVDSAADSELDLKNWSSENVLHHQSRSSGLLTPEVGLTPDLGAWHSTGHLVDDEPHAGSAPPHGLRPRPFPRRLSHHLRSRMCRSLGADLDRAFREDADAARLRRLQRVTSFLNVASVPTSRAHSPLGSMSSSGSLHSLGPDAPPYAPRPPQVPLEPQEHEWFVKAAAGNWTEVYALFREEPSLLCRRDFVSGFTVLHWIAKHGDHRVLNTLCYGVSKVGVALDVNVRSACGYTPLHLAAIHGHKNLLRLLVHKFKANVALRDNSGRRAWQYLERSDDQDLLELLKGACRGGGGAQWALDKPPAGPGGKSAAAVKRHASLAALFKHKSNLRVAPHAESFL